MYIVHFVIITIAIIDIVIIRNHDESQKSPKWDNWEELEVGYRNY